MSPKKAKPKAAKKRPKKTLPARSNGKHPGGRPTVFTQEVAEQILAMARRGSIDAEICEAIGVSVTTLTNWKNAYPEFLAALRVAKDSVDDLVESALLKRALGYEHESVKIFCSEGKIVTKNYTERYAPDTTAMIFWLKNRRMKDWRDVARRELTGVDGGPLDVNTPQIVITIPSNGREAKDE